MDTLEGKVAVVTGAAVGSVARSRTRWPAGERRSLPLTSMKAGLRRVVAELRELGVNAAPRPADIGDAIAFDGIRDAALERFGRVDIVVNNVGVLTNGLPQDIPTIEWERILNINLMSVVRSNATFVPMLLDQGSGHIVNTASFAGLFTYSYDRMPYAASKAAIVQISEGLALYLRPKNIGVTMLCPGPVLTNITSNMPTFGGGATLRTPGEQFELFDAARVGELVADAILQNRFFVPTHPQVTDELRRRVEDWDAYLDYQISRESLAPKGDNS